MHLLPQSYFVVKPHHADIVEHLIHACNLGRDEVAVVESVESYHQKLAVHTVHHTAVT